MSVSRFASACSALLVGLSLFGCSVTPLGATETGVSAAKQKNPVGADIYDRECASCHGKRGEGLSAAPNIMGPGALPVYARDPSTTGSLAVQAESQQQENMRPPGQQTRQPFKTAADLYEFVSHWMPKPQARVGSLKADEYWAVVNYILIAHGSVVPPEGVNEQNAKNVAVARP